ncbi:MAG: peptidoglycan DD-metalloendopeptidase family protein [Clostridiales bacterium]|nr:peptidoglycan DD-metalloendopeptidase family protein [Clostridiales bacterium]
MAARPYSEAHFAKSILTTVLLALTLSSCPGALAQQDIAELEKRLAKINEEIQVLEAKIRQEKAKEATLLSQLDSISWQKKLIRNELSLLAIQMEKTTRELSSLKDDITKLKKKLEREQQGMEQTLVTLYKYGKFNFLQFLLETENISALFAESKHLSLLANHQQTIISDYLKTISDLKEAESSQEAKKEELVQLIRDTDQKKKELEAQEAEGRELIRKIQINKKNYEQALKEQSERAEQLQSLMKKLAAQEITLPFKFVPFYEKKGKLPWPISGKIITRFGLERHQQFNTITMNNGIEISPQKGSSVVSSIHPGKVVFADYFQGYGNLLIIDHGMNYYSLYGHCAEFLVNKGDLVKEGQAIAIVGDTGSLKGISLYLEIRFRTKPLDPLQWLKRR